MSGGANLEELIFPRNEEQAVPMAKYMKNHFPFAGAPKPERARLQKKFLVQSKQLEVTEVLSLAKKYYQKAEREYQYVAIELIQLNVRRLAFSDLVMLLSLVQEKEWWDSIDSWRKVYTTWCKAHPDQLEQVFNLFIQQEDFWLRRIAITLQLGLKEKVNQSLLKKAILQDRETTEFFIQKGIGWALRDYSKTNPGWVKDLLEQEALSKLAEREASKYL